jgi:hypothetical protein
MAGKPPLAPTPGRRPSRTRTPPAANRMHEKMETAAAEIDPNINYIMAQEIQRFENTDLDILGETPMFLIDRSWEFKCLWVLTQTLLQLTREERHLLCYKDVPHELQDKLLLIFDTTWRYNYMAAGTAYSLQPYLEYAVIIAYGSFGKPECYVS